MRYFWYVLSRFCKAQLTLLISFLILFSLVDYAINAKYFAATTSHLLDALHYYTATFAVRLDLFLPLSICLAGLYTIHSLKQAQELTALGAAGISNTKALSPILFMSVVFSIFMVFHYEYTYPLAAKQVTVFEEQTLGRRKTLSSDKQANVFHLEDGTTLFFTHRDPITQALKSVYIVTQNNMVFQGDTYFPKTGDLINATTFTCSKGLLHLQEENIPIMKLHKIVPLFSPEKRGKSYFKGHPISKLYSKRNSTKAHQIRALFDSALSYKIAAMFFPLLIGLFLIPHSFTYERKMETAKSTFFFTFSALSVYILFLMLKTLGESNATHPFLSQVTLIVLLAAILFRRYTLPYGKQT